jgi:hypothetical protein
MTSRATNSAGRASALHPPLSDSPHSIRLLELHPGSSTKSIKCTTYSVNLCDKPKYYALSYAWGPVLPVNEINLNSHQFPIRENLWNFLNRIRPEERVITLWCDQICIDQSNASEKSQQVQNMGKVYQNAESVWIWLGELDDEMTKTMNFLSAIAKLYDQLLLNIDPPERSAVGNEWDHIRRKKGLGRRPTLVASDFEHLLDATKTTDIDREDFATTLRHSHPEIALSLSCEAARIYRRHFPPDRVNKLCVFSLTQELVKRQYWQRAWIVQELILSKASVVYAGSAFMTFWMLQGLAMNITTPWFDPHWWPVAVAAWPLGELMESRDICIVPATIAYETNNLFNFEAWPQNRGNELHSSAATNPIKLRSLVSRNGFDASLLGSLFFTSKSQCTDWRDRFYSILAITKECRAGVKFRIDYSCTKTQMFFNIMQYVWLERFFFNSAQRAADYLSIDLGAFVKARSLPSRFRLASENSNDGIILACDDEMLVCRVDCSDKPVLVDLEADLWYGKRQIKVLSFMHEKDCKILPGQLLLTLSEDFFAITNSRDDHATILGWAFVVGPDFECPEHMTIIPDYETLAELQLHGPHGCIDQQHICLNEPQVLALLSMKEIIWPEKGASSTASPRLPFAGFMENNM